MSTNKTPDEFKRVAEVGANLFELMHLIKDNGLDEGIAKFKENKEKEQTLDEDDF